MKCTVNSVCYIIFLIFIGKYMFHTVNVVAVLFSL